MKRALQLVTVVMQTAAALAPIGHAEAGAASRSTEEKWIWSWSGCTRRSEFGACKIRCRKDWRFAAS